MPAPIDGYDWDIRDETSPSYHPRDLDDACRRALQWCQAQSPHLQDRDWSWDGIAPVPVGDDGWLFVGNVIRWDGTRQAIHWDPSADAVRVERYEPPDRTVPLPPREPWLREPDLPPLPPREDTTIHVGIGTIVPILQEATRERRALVTDPLIDPCLRDELIGFGMASLPLRVRPDGWVRIGFVTDEIARIVLAVDYEPASRATRTAQVEG